MKIVTTFHQPSSVLSSLKCRLASRDLEHLVVAKLSRVDVFSLQSEGLKHECGLDIWGKILAIKAVPISGSVRSNILIMIDHPDPEIIFLTYSESGAGTGELTSRKHLSLFERSPRPAEFFNDVLIDPAGKLAVVSCYTGKLKIILLKAGSYDQDFDASLPELNVLDMTLLPSPEDGYSLAILHIDHRETLQLLSRDIHLEDFELSPSLCTLLPNTPLSAKSFPSATELIPKLIPVPPLHSDTCENSGSENDGFMGGVLVVGGRKLLLYELASKTWQEKQRGKKRRLETRKKSMDSGEVSRAKEKEKEREGKKRKSRASVDWPWSEVTAWCAVDQHSLRYLIGDSFGRLSMLSVDGLKDHGLILIPLGESSPPTTLTYLTTQVLYVGSHMGDSQLLRIHPAPVSALDSPTLPISREIKTTPSMDLISPSKGKGKADAEIQELAGFIVEGMGSHMSVLESFKNIAPIVDAVLVDTDGSGQRQIVTCSGGRNTGSINVIRNGADFHEVATIAGLTNVTNVWPIRACFDDTLDTHILVSTLQGTHLFQIDNGSTISRVESAAGGFISNLPTLAISNMARRVVKDKRSTYINSSLVVQVTPKGAFLLEFNIPTREFTQLAGWELREEAAKPIARPLEIVAASVNASQVVLALTGGRLVTLTVSEMDQFREVVRGVVGSYSEISAVSCTPLDPSKYFSNYILVSYWGSNCVEMFTFEPTGFSFVCKTPPLSSLVRSLLLHNFGLDHSSKGPEYHPHLLIGLGDGSIVSFSLKNNQFKDQKVVTLGHAPVCLTACLVEGKRSVFAAGSRATVLSWEKQRLHHSPIMLKEITTASRLNTEIFSSSLILGTTSGLSIGRVKDLDKMHIRKVPLGLDNPRRIAYDPFLKVFGVACTRAEPGRIGDPESSKSSFRLLDDMSFNHLSQFNCELDEEITAVTTMNPVIGSKTMSLFCLGTLWYQPTEKEPTNGRLLIFTAYNNEIQPGMTTLHLSLVTSAYVKGCVYSLTIVNGMVAAAVNASVMLFHLDASNYPSMATFALHKVAEWNHNYFVTSLVSYGDNLVAGDHISSVSVLKVVNSQLQTVARDYGPLWPVCVEALDEKSVIGANDTLNLFTFTLVRTAGRGVLERDGNYHIADLVTKFLRGTLTSPDISSNIPLEAKQIFVTSSGRIGVIVDITDDQLSLHLTALQRNMANVNKGVGGTSHTRYRSPKNSRGRSDADAASFGFLDGDFLEQLLTHMSTPQLIEQILLGQSVPERLTLPLEEMQKVLETLQSLH